MQSLAIARCTNKYLYIHTWCLKPDIQMLDPHLGMTILTIVRSVKSTCSAQPSSTV